MKDKDTTRNNEMFVFGLKHFKTVEVDNHKLIGCESVEFYENDKLSNFWSNEFIKREIEKRDFKITEWFFMTIVKRNSFFLNSENCV